MYPGKNHYVWHTFELVTQSVHGYLLVDLKQNTPDELRLHSYIFPGATRAVYTEDH